MALKIIGAGVGRTGTYSLKLALNQLGFGPCHHMEEVLLNQPAQVPLWADAVAGRADWEAVFAGYPSAVDWPTAGFFRELAAAYPSARFILTDRRTDSWVESFSATIYKLIAGRDQIPDEMRAWMDMAVGVVSRTGFPDGLDKAGLAKAFDAHNEAVKATIPADRLLVFQVKE
ncbi:MAG TPA: sulfotransferase, partial [Thermohalobaculum sp.]|nr:sulfotransferase [Thermohalobaculum sp.]